MFKVVVSGWRGEAGMITCNPVESIRCCLTPPPVGQDIVGEVRVLTGLLLLRFAREIDESCPRDNFGGKLFDDGGTEGGEKHPFGSPIPLKFGIPGSSNDGSSFNTRPILLFANAFAALRTACGGLGVNVGGERVLDTSDNTFPPSRKS